MLCLSVCLVFTIIPFIASLLRREGKQALKKTRQTDKHSINIKEGAIKCCKEIKITSPPNEGHNIPFKLLSKLVKRAVNRCYQNYIKQIACYCYFCECVFNYRLSNMCFLKKTFLSYQIKNC